MPLERDAAESLRNRWTCLSEQQRDSIPRTTRREACEDKASCVTKNDRISLAPPRYALLNRRTLDNLPRKCG